MLVDELTVQLNTIRARTRELVANLTPDQLSQRPDPASWSIAECLSHLNLTAAVVQPKIGAAIEKGRMDNVTGSGPFSPGPLGRLLIWIAEPPPKFRIRAPKSISPAVAHGDPAQVVADFMNFQDGWEKLIRDCDGLNQNRIKIPSLFPGMPRLRLAAPIPWMMAHERRHLVQAEEVKRRIMQALSVARE